MGKRILLQVQNTTIKGMIIKYLIEAGLEVVDIVDYKDLLFKISVYPSNFVLFIIEITEESLSTIFDEIAEIKENEPFINIPILALIPRDTPDIITSALKSGIEDVFLIPKSSASFKQHLHGKINAAIKQFVPIEFSSKYKKKKSEEIDIEKVKELIYTDIKLANRGKYPISFLMIKFTKVKEDDAYGFIERLSRILRETDKILRLSDFEWVIVCPFTEKKYIIEVERKVFVAFRAEMESEYNNKKINLDSATYPEDSESLDKILEKLELGIKNNMAINKINVPLKSLSPKELEDYKKIIQQYKKFF